MFSTRGGGEGPGGVGGAANTAVPQGSGDGGGEGAGAGAGAAVLDLIQPHSVSAEEVAGFYGGKMGQVRQGVDDWGDVHKTGCPPNGGRAAVRERWPSCGTHARVAQGRLLAGSLRQAACLSFCSGVLAATIFLVYRVSNGGLSFLSLRPPPSLPPLLPHHAYVLLVPIQLA